MFDAITDLLTDDGFRTGLVLGLVAAVATGLAAAIARPVRPWAGLAFGVATVVAMADRFSDADRFPVTGELVVGLAVLTAGGILTARWPLVVRMAAAVPGAVIVARSADLTEVTDLAVPGWAAPAIVVATVVGGALAGECDRAPALRRHGLPPVMLAVTVLGVYATTPDTEHARVLAGVALAIALLGWPRPLASLGVAGSFVAVALVSWTAVVDGLGRPGAIVGGVACLGLLAVEPAVRWALDARRARHPLPRSPAQPSAALRDALTVGALHVGLVAACSRVAGLRTSATQALVISAVAYAVAATALVALRARPSRIRAGSNHLA
jgi:hypothetical protein